jgi:hypothetical protein
MPACTPRPEHCRRRPGNRLRRCPEGHEIWIDPSTGTVYECRRRFDPNAGYIYVWVPVDDLRRAR